jgi:hypothetical protein
MGICEQEQSVPVVERWVGTLLVSVGLTTAAVLGRD